VGATADTATTTLEAIERYAPDIDVPPPAVLDQARRNLQLRVAMLREFGAVSAAELADLVGSTARRPATLVDNWRRAHRVVAVRWRDKTLVPGFFLLEDGQPDPAARGVLMAAVGRARFAAPAFLARGPRVSAGVDRCQLSQRDGRDVIRQPAQPIVFGRSELRIASAHG
jgi:hypothetical protein